MTTRPPVDGGTALITGASSGIGRELAAQLATRAGTLVAAARRAGLPEELRAGTAGEMAGGPPQFLRISAARCAREALAGFDAGQALVFPGRACRTAMRVLPLLPRSPQRRQAASAVRFRSQAHHTAAEPRSTPTQTPQNRTPA